ncbi:GDSL lipase/esterase [Dillenia turbinata]|uniref:GDSL lipase/esterase n=1 Tax=Dillenia turbinata TaxID=194707 RepID=A0AAN8W088_9MAGN
MSKGQVNMTGFFVGCYVITLLVLLFGASEAVIKLPPNISLPALIAFGDSIVDPGNNNGLTTVAKSNFYPYGKDFEGGRPTGRFSNGKIPTDLIAEELGIKDLVPAYLDPALQIEDLATGVSFASGAAGYDPLTSAIPSVISMSGQFNLFKEYKSKIKSYFGEERTNFIIENALYVVVAGSDDITNTYYAVPFRRAHYDINSYTDLMINKAVGFYKDLYGEGARRIAVFGAPPLGCLPSQRTLAGGLNRVCVEEYNAAAQLFNSKLSPQLKSLTNQLPNSRIVYIDIYSPLLDLIQNPSKNGFEVVDKGCCGTGNIEASILCNKFTPPCMDASKHVFWDSYHPTERAYQVIIKRILPQYLNSFF